LGSRGIAVDVATRDAPGLSGAPTFEMKHRLLRVNELVKREVSGIIARELNFGDTLVSISHVDVTADLKNAHVFVSVLGPGSGAEVIGTLESNRSLLQIELGRRLTLKNTPHLLFRLDDSIARGSRVIEILREIEASPSEDK
jgi:ribosome-binding factor A